MSDTITPPPARIRVRSRGPIIPPATQTSTADYEVGYCRPPKHTQFQPKKSGNAKGRKKGSRNASTILKAELAKAITAKVGGRPVKMTRLEAIIQRFIERCLAGDMRAISMLLKFEQEVPAGAGAVDAAAEPPLSAAELAIMATLLAAAKQSAGGAA